MFKSRIFPLDIWCLFIRGQNDRIHHLRKMHMLKNAHPRYELYAIAVNLTYNNSSPLRNYSSYSGRDKSQVNSDVGKQTGNIHNTDRFSTMQSTEDTSQAPQSSQPSQPSQPFKLASKSSKFGIEAKVASKIPKYQARFQESTVTRIYNETRFAKLMRLMNGFIQNNKMPEGLSRKDKLIFIGKKYWRIYMLLILFWMAIVYIYQSVIRKSVPIVGIDTWNEFIPGIIYTARVYFRMNGRIPMSINSAAVKLSNEDVLLYNPLPPEKPILQFLLELLLVNMHSDENPKHESDKNTRWLHIIVPNDLDISFAHDFFKYSNPGILNIHFYVYEKNKKFLKSLQKWIDEKDIPLAITFISSPNDFPECIRNDLDVKIVTELKNLNEIVLYHKKANVAIMGDITQNVVLGKTLPTDFTRTRMLEKIMHFNGNIGTFGRVPPKSVISDNYKNLLDKMEEISKWGFNGLIMSCGELIHPNEIPNVHIEFLKRWMGVVSKKMSESGKDQSIKRT